MPASHAATGTCLNYLGRGGEGRGRSVCEVTRIRDPSLGNVLPQTKTFLLKAEFQPNNGQFRVIPCLATDSLLNPANSAIPYAIL